MKIVSAFKREKRSYYEKVNCFYFSVTGMGM